jgi:DNA polymerase-1
MPDVTTIENIFGMPIIRKRKVKQANTEVPDIKKDIKIQYSENKDYKLVLNISDLDKYLMPMWKRENKILSFDFETSPLEQYREIKKAALNPHMSQITGISFSHTQNTGIYLPLTHRIGQNFCGVDPDGLKDFLQIIKFIFDSKDILKISHNAAFESMFLYKYGIVLQPPIFDTIAAAMMSLKNEKYFRLQEESGLKTLTEEIFKCKRKSYNELTDGKSFDELDPSNPEVIYYGCADSDDALQLHDYYKDWFAFNIPKHYDVVKNIESPTAIYCGIMQYNGILVDKNLMQQKHDECSSKITELENKIYDLIGRKINIGKNASTKAFKEYLFIDQKLPVMKTTEKDKESADDEAFILLKEYCEIQKLDKTKELIETVQEYRKYGKLLSTYITGYMKHINDVTNRIHANPNPLKTDTGRFAYNKPNLQNMPRKDNDLIGIRKFFIPRPGYVYLDFDFSQIELRVGAFFCRDEKMLDTYRNDGDIHALTTSVIYDIPFTQAIDKNADNYKERRTIAKNCNFGTFFGLFAKGLKRTLKFKAGLDKTELECEDIINNLKAGYPKLTEWQEDTKKEAARTQYSETAFGRRRILRSIDSKDWGTKSFWERVALNTPIQGTAAEILKLALGRIVQRLPEIPWLLPVLQVHDELLFECREDKVEDGISFIKYCMEKKPFEAFDMPIKAEGAIGKSFGELEELQ